MRISIASPIPDIGSMPGPSRPGWGPAGSYDFQFEVTGAVTIKANAAGAGNFRVSWPNGTTQVLSGNNASVVAPDGEPGIVSINNEKLDDTYADEFAIVGGQTNVSKVISWGQNPWSNMTNAFNGCTSLSDISTTSFISSAQGDMVTMFNGCTSLLEADIRNWDLSAGADWYGGSPFRNLVNLQKLDMTGLNIKLVYRSDYAFSGIGTAVTDGCEFLMSNIDWSTTTSSNSSTITINWFSSTKLNPNSNLSNWIFPTSGWRGSGMFNSADITGTNSTLNLSGWSTYSGTELPQFSSFNDPAGDTGLKIDMTNMGMSNVTSFLEMFYYSDISEVVGLSTWGATAGNVNMRSMFTGCSHMKFSDSDNFTSTFINSLTPTDVRSAFYGVGNALTSGYGVAPNITNIDLSNCTDFHQFFGAIRCTNVPALNTATFPSTAISLTNLFTSSRFISGNETHLDFSNVAIKISNTANMFSSTWIDKVTFGNNVDFSALTNVTNMHYYMNYGNPDGTTAELTYPTNADFSSLTTTGNWFAGVQGPTTGPLTTCQIDNLIRRFRATAYGNALNINFYQGQITEAPSVVRTLEAELVANGWTISENSTDATLPFAYPSYNFDSEVTQSVTPTTVPTGGQFSSTDPGVTVDEDTGVVSWDSTYMGLPIIRCTYTDGCYNEVQMSMLVTVDNNYSMEFDRAASTYMVIPGFTDVFTSEASSNNAFSISLWYKHTSVGLNHYMVGSGANADGPFSFVSSGPNPRIRMRDSGGTQYIYTTADSPVAINTWAHVVAVWDGTASATNRLKIYVNGVQNTSASITGPTSIQTSGTGYNSNTLFGTYRESTINSSDIHLDEVGFFTRPLTADQVKLIYDANSANKSIKLTSLPGGAPIAWFRLGD